MAGGQDIDNGLDALRGWLQSAQRHEAHLLSLLHDAQAEVNTIKSRFAALEAQKYPINRIPNELLVYIFTLFVQDLDQDYGEGESRLCHWRPIVLSHVSHQWRTLALSTSRIWSKIVLSKGSPVSAVDHFVTHAGISTLDIVGNDIDDDDLTRHCALISPECLPRWRAVTISTSGPSSMVTILHYPSISLRTHRLFPPVDPETLLRPLAPWPGHIYARLNVPPGRPISRFKARTAGGSSHPQRPYRRFPQHTHS